MRSGKRVSTPSLPPDPLLARTGHSTAHARRPARRGTIVGSRQSAGSRRRSRRPSSGSSMWLLPATSSHATASSEMAPITQDEKLDLALQPEIWLLLRTLERPKRKCRIRDRGGDEAAAVWVVRRATTHARIWAGGIADGSALPATASCWPSGTAPPSAARSFWSSRATRTDAIGRRFRFNACCLLVVGRQQLTLAGWRGALGRAPYSDGALALPDTTSGG